MAAWVHALFCRADSWLDVGERKLHMRIQELLRWNERSCDVLDLRSGIARFQSRSRVNR